MIGLNLLPDVKKEFIKAQRTRNIVISISILTMMVVGGATAFLALFVYVVQGAATTFVKDDIVKNEKTLEAKPEIGKYLTIQNQLHGLKTLQSPENRVVYSRLLDYLIKLNPAAPYNAGFGAVKVSRESNLINVQGITKSTSMQSLDVFKNTLEKAKLTYMLENKQTETPLFSAVVLKSAGLSQEGSTPGVSFEFDLTYSPEIFRSDITNINLVVPKQTISDSQTNAPKELFNGSTKESQ